MAIPDPPKAGSPFCALWTGGWNPKTPKINNFFIPEITLRGGYLLPRPRAQNRISTTRTVLRGIFRRCGLLGDLS